MRVYCSNSIYHTIILKKQTEKVTGGCFINKTIYRFYNFKNVFVCNRQMKNNTNDNSNKQDKHKSILGIKY